MIIIGVYLINCEAGNDSIASLLREKEKAGLTIGREKRGVKERERARERERERGK